MTHQPLIFLASQSPRRRELLNQIGINHQVVRTEVNEMPLPGEAPAEYVIRLALEKARSGRRALGPNVHQPVLGADTTVVVDNTILGKPIDQLDAEDMLSKLSNREHQVLTGVALVSNRDELTCLSVSQVHFREIGPAEAADYWQTGEPEDKAGGYAVQGLAALFISRIEGSFSGVMGLPLFETGELLKRSGIIPIRQSLNKSG